MNIAYTEEQLALKQRISCYMKDIVTDELIEEMQDLDFLEGGGPIFQEKMLKGKIIISVGYSEPNAGTDLASLTTRAEKDAATGDWIINGQSLWQ